MSLVRLIALAACLLAGAGAADAGTVRLGDLLDYESNTDGPYYFLPPDVPPDQPPYFRSSLEDWNWTHSMKDQVPADANGIRDASLDIEAWDVDTREGEIDVVYANGVELGSLRGMDPGQDHVWTTTEFKLPASVVQELWQNGELTIFMDIDRDTVGDRVTIRKSGLIVSYTKPGGAPSDPNVTVYRFWSPVLSGHFYTTSEQERDMLIRDFGCIWTCEGVAYYAFGAPLDGNLKPVYRFWSGHSHFYTINEDEKQMLVDQYSYVWTLEGVAWYAYDWLPQWPSRL